MRSGEGGGSPCPAPFHSVHRPGSPAPVPHLSPHAPGHTEDRTGPSLPRENLEQSGEGLRAAIVRGPSGEAHSLWASDSAGLPSPRASGPPPAGRGGASWPSGPARIFRQSQSKC